MIILGVDPGYAIVGVGIIEYEGNRFRMIDYGAITTKAHTPTSYRLAKIYDELNICLDKYSPAAVAMEKLYFNTNQKTAIDVAQARGAMVACITKAGVPIYEYTPLQVKQAVTGYGRAEKQQIQTMVKMLLNLRGIPKPDDAADALAVAICHAHSCRMPGIEPM